MTVASSFHSATSSSRKRRLARCGSSGEGARPQRARRFGAGLAPPVSGAAGRACPPRFRGRNRRAASSRVAVFLLPQLGEHGQHQNASPQLHRQVFAQRRCLCATSHNVSYVTVYRIACQDETAGRLGGVARPAPREEVGGAGRGWPSATAPVSEPPTEVHRESDDGGLGRGRNQVQLPRANGQDLARHDREHVDA